MFYLTKAIIIKNLKVALVSANKKLRFILSIKALNIA